MKGEAIPIRIDTTETKVAVDYEIVLEEVEDLGYFMEVEYCTNEDVDVKNVKKQIQSFINSLDIKVSEELTMGKPEMIIKKNNISID